MGEMGEMFQSKWRSIVGAPDGCFRFLIYYFISKLELDKGDWGRKSRSYLAFLTLCKIWGSWVKCLSEFYEFSLGSNVLYAFDGTPLDCLGDASLDVNTGHEQYKGLPANVERSQL